MIADYIRDVEELKKLYESRPMPHGYNWEWLINNPHLYCFYDEEKGFLRGYITMQNEDGELTLSGASIRKNFEENVRAVKMVCEAYSKTSDKPIYSYTPLKEAALVLRKAGFKKLYDNKYIYEVN